MKWTNEARIGAVVVLAGFVLIGGILYLRGIDIRAKQYSLSVFYRNVTGLQSGDLVTVSGLMIGHVESMVLKGRQIRVDLSIKAKVLLPRDSRAILKSESIMGGKFIEVTPGADTVMLTDGDSLMGLYQADLSELTATLAPISSNVLGILENVNSTFDERTRQSIKAIVADLARSTARLDEAVRTGGADAERAFSEFADFSNDLSHFARTIDTLAVVQRGNVDTSMTALRRMAENLDRASSKLERTTESLDIVFAKLRNGEGSLGKLVHDEALYNDLDSLSVNLNRLVKDIRENPDRYVQVSVF
jgi:phospholipid/cholesterol/gamma-HCH transport system substrate-binding protein